MDLVYYFLFQALTFVSYWLSVVIEGCTSVSALVHLCSLGCPFVTFATWIFFLEGCL